MAFWKISIKMYEMAPGDTQTFIRIFSYLYAAIRYFLTLNLVLIL